MGTPAVFATYTGPGELVTIVATTQLHLDGVAIGVGNIWDEDYTPTPGEVRHGLTGMVFVSVAADNSKNFALRVHPGQELDIPGYHLQVLAVDERSISLAIEERPQ